MILSDGGVGTNINQGITYISSAKNGNANRRYSERGLKGF